MAGKEKYRQNIVDDEYELEDDEDIGGYYFYNELTKEVRDEMDEPEIWIDQDNDYLCKERRCNFYIKIDLLQFVPIIIRDRHKQRYIKLIQDFAGCEFNLVTELICLIATYVSSLAL